MKELRLTGAWLAGRLACQQLSKLAFLALVQGQERGPATRLRAMCGWQW